MAESHYAESIFLNALGNAQGSIELIEGALEMKPDYAPAIMSKASIEYQRGNEEEGARLFKSLLTLPDAEGDLWEIIDHAGDILIESEKYGDGLELMEAAVDRFPDHANQYQNLTICASHEGFYEKALAASQKALELEPDRQYLVTNLGWSLYEAGRIEEAEKVLQKAAEMDPEDHYARNNLRICRQALSEKRVP